MPLGREASRISRLTTFDIKNDAVSAVSLQAGLALLIMLRSGDAFIDHSLIIASPFLVLIIARGNWHFVSG
jgi:hypothetical protein